MFVTSACNKIHSSLSMLLHVKPVLVLDNIGLELAGRNSLGEHEVQPVVPAKFSAVRKPMRLIAPLTRP